MLHIATDTEIEMSATEDWQTEHNDNGPTELCSGHSLLCRTADTLSMATMSEFDDASLIWLIRIGKGNGGTQKMW